MPDRFRAFRNDVKLNSRGIPSHSRSIATLGQVPFWWAGEYFVTDSGRDQPRWVTSWQDPSQLWHADHEYNIERSREVWEAFPVLRGWGSVGTSFNSPEEARELGLALTEMAKDKNAPSADAVAIAARFMLLAASHDCYTEVSGI